MRNLQQFQGIDKRYYQNQTPTFPEDLGKKKKKEVSFSLEDDLDKSLDISGHSILDDQRFNLYHPGPEQDKLKHFDQFLINPNADNRKNNLLKGSHDSSSDTSTDLTASDSGRGGSDVEMQHSSNAPDEEKTYNLSNPYTRASSFPPTVYTPPDRGGTRASNKADNSASNKKDYTGLTPRETFEKKHGINRHSQESTKSESCLPSYV
uniref:Uncharacterized protein n=1 Tax=Magallana gigas TaxID=29159 RepID=K1PPE3_MAGGI